MGLKLTILGCHSATPRPNANPSAQVLEIKNQTFLIDCGEGTQKLLRQNKISFAKISSIFISHLHGDHFFGLPGLLSTFSLLGRQKPVNIYAPTGIKDIILHLFKVSNSHQNFEINFQELSSLKPEVILSDDNVEVSTIPLTHRVYTNGFLFREKHHLRNLNIENIQKYPEIARCDYYRIKKGEDFMLQNGHIIKNDELTLKPKPLLSYAYCSDTSYNKNIIPIIKNVDLLYHETTFLTEHEELALKTGHSTTKNAANIANAANVRQLIIGHYSSRYKDKSRFLSETQSIFNNSLLGIEGETYSVP